MREIFESIKEQLEERRKLHNELSKSEKLTENEQLIQTRLDGAFGKAISIVNEVEHEYTKKTVTCENCANKPQCPIYGEYDIAFCSKWKFKQQIINPVNEKDLGKLHKNIPTL